MNSDYPRNADRAKWAGSAMARFATLTGLDRDLQDDPETVLADLLADLMHWCDAQRTNHRVEDGLGFLSALGRARRHYQEEFGREEPGRPKDPAQ